MADDEEWVEVRRFDDTVHAQMVEDFLVHSGVRVQRRGDGGHGVLNRLNSVIDVRLVVPASQLEEAAEVLRALDTQTKESAFRGPEPGDAPPPESKIDLPKKWGAASILAILVPIGSGHFYARHAVTGKVLALGIVCGFLLGVLLAAPYWMFASMTLIAIDAASAPFAVMRHNANATWSPAKQSLWGLGAVVVALGVARLLAR